MQSVTDLDRLRAWLEGRLQGAELAALERELERDPALAELAERLRDVFALTAAEAEPPPCRVTFADIERQLAVPVHAPWGRRAAAAALILAAAGAATWALRGGLGQAPVPGDPAPVVARTPGEAPTQPSSPRTPRTPRSVQLNTLALGEAPTEEVAPAWVPAVLASFDPRGEGRITWLEDERAGSFIARAARRPMLVLGSLEDCPDCARMNAEVFNQAGVLGLIDLYVPLQWNLSAMPEKESMMIRERRGYPLLEVWSGYDEVALNFSGVPGAATFEEMMLQGLDRTGVSDEAPGWDDLRDWAERWLAAEQARSTGRVALAQRGWRDLARRAAGNLLAEQAVASLRQLADEARDALLDARDLAGSDPAAAAARLEDAAGGFADTEYEADLRAVLDALRADGVFPELLDPPGR